MNTPSPKCLVTSSHLVTLIHVSVHSLLAGHFGNGIELEHHYRYVVTQQVEMTFQLAEEIGLDLWSEVAGPLGRPDATIAELLREMEEEFGLQKCCAVPGCGRAAVFCCTRPPSLPQGTRWPSCPEVCEMHSKLRFDALARRIRKQAPDRTGPIHAALMPMPDVAELAPTPEELAKIGVN